MFFCYLFEAKTIGKGIWFFLTRQKRDWGDNEWTFSCAWWRHVSFFFMSSSSYIDWRERERQFLAFTLAFLLYSPTTSYPLESFLLSINEKDKRLSLFATTDWWRMMMAARCFSLALRVSAFVTGLLPIRPPSNGICPFFFPFDKRENQVIKPFDWLIDWL